MFASLPFILLLILQGFARQDCAEFLLGNQDLVNVPSQARSLKAFDGLLVHFVQVGKFQRNCSQNQTKRESKYDLKVALIPTHKGNSTQAGFVEVQRSRDGPVA
jgi:hypothetical protein